MEVRRKYTPGTAVPVKRMPLATPASISDGGIGQALAGVGQLLKKNELENQQFDVQNRLVQEALDMQNDYQTRQLAAEPGAAGFTQKFVTDTMTRHKAIREELLGKGYDEELVNRMTGQLGSMTVSYSGNALGWELGQRKTFNVSRGNNAADGISRTVNANPNSYVSAKEQLDEIAFSMPGLTKAEQIEWRDRQLPGIRKAAALGLDPSYVLQKLRVPTAAQGGMPGFGDEGGPFNMVSYLQKNRTAESSGDDKAHPETSSAYGRYQFLEKTWLFNYKEVYGETGETPGAILAKRAEGDIQDTVMTHFTQKNIEKLQAAGLPVTNSTVYLMHFLGEGDAPKVLAASPDTPIEGLVSPASIAANKWVFAEVKTAGDLLAWSAGKVGTAGAVAAVPPVSQTPEEIEADKQFQETGLTGDPILDDMDGVEREQTIAWATGQMNQQKTEKAAALQVRESNALAESSQTGDYTGPRLTEQEYVDLYGNIRGPQMYAEFNARQQMYGRVASFAQKSPGEINAVLAKMQPVQGSPTYAKELEAYNAAVKARDSIMTERQTNPHMAVMRAFPELQGALLNARTQDQRELAYRQMWNSYELLGIPEEKRLPFSANGAANFIKTYSSASYASKLDQLDDLKDQLGPLWKNALVQLAKSGIEVDAMMADIVDSSPDHRIVAQDVFKGLHMMDENPNYKMPGQKTLEITRGFYSGATETNQTLVTAYQKAAWALYIARNGNPKADSIDKSAYKDALRQVMGGESGKANTGAVVMDNYWGGEAPIATILPPGTNGSQFRRFIDSATDSYYRQNELNGSPITAAGDPVTAQQIADYGAFVLLSPNVYRVQMQNTGQFLTNAQGGFYMVRVTRDNVFLGSRPAPRVRPTPRKRPGAN